jgi:hypothetical protein
VAGKSLYHLRYLKSFYFLYKSYLKKKALYDLKEAKFGKGIVPLIRKMYGTTIPANLTYKNSLIYKLNYHG